MDISAQRPPCFCFTVRALAITNLPWWYIALIVAPFVIFVVDPRCVYDFKTFLAFAFYGLVCANALLFSVLLIPLSHKTRFHFIKRLMFGHFKVVWTSEEPVSELYKSCLFGYHPHGANCISIGALLLLPPLQDSVILAASILTVIPIFRLFFCLSGGFLSVCKTNLDWCLASGLKTMLVPGGIREMHLSRPFNDEIGLYIDHKGFVKSAIQHGRNLVGIINFEENDMNVSYCPVSERLCFRYARLSGFPGWRNRFFMPVPNRLQVHVAFTKIIPVEQNDNPSAEMIDSVHHLYYSEVQRVFEARKAEFGHGGRRLAFYQRCDLEAIYKEGCVTTWKHVPQREFKKPAWASSVEPEPTELGKSVDILPERANMS